MSTCCSGSPADYFDRQVLGEAGVDRLVARSTLTHTDDRPQLEFVAARRFLDAGSTGSILDSLAAIERPVESVDRLSPLRLARALSARLGDPAGTTFLFDARALGPVGPDVGRGPGGDRSHTRVIHRSPMPCFRRCSRASADPRVLLLSGLVATARHQPDQARALLGRALAAGLRHRSRLCRTRPAARTRQSLEPDDRRRARVAARRPQHIPVTLPARSAPSHAVGSRPPGSARRCRQPAGGGRRGAPRVGEALRAAGRGVAAGRCVRCCCGSVPDVAAIRPGAGGRARTGPAVPSRSPLSQKEGGGLSPSTCRISAAASMA